MSEPAPRFAMLADLDKETTSEGRRELLRRVTGAMAGGAPQGQDPVLFDHLLAGVAADYSAQVRADLARLIAGNDMFAAAAQLFAMDDQIEVAAPVLKHSRALTEETLLKVIQNKSQDHMMAVTGRRQISPVVSHALVERGNDAVVGSLLANDNASIAPDTFDVVAQRAQTSAVLQSPLVKRRDVPLEMLNHLYHQVEAKVRREIMEKFSHVPADEVESAFRRNRGRAAAVYGGAPADMAAAKLRVGVLNKHGDLKPPVLVSLLREGPSARTAFMLAFANLVDVEFNLVQRAVEEQNLDTVALLCRGADFQRALFVALAIALDGKDQGLAGADEFGRMYESVPVVAAQRALRFWKVRASA
jgi:uncharacterized protein (DUF2336 family)